MSVQPKPWANIHDTETLQILMDNISRLEYPLPGYGTQIIKLPYFDDFYRPNQDAVKETRKRFCEALVILLEKHDRLRKKPKRLRKDGGDS